MVAEAMWKSLTWTKSLKKPSITSHQRRLTRPLLKLQRSKRKASKRKLSMSIYLRVNKSAHTKNLPMKWKTNSSRITKVTTCLSQLTWLTWYLMTKSLWTYSLRGWSLNTREFPSEYQRMTSKLESVVRKNLLTSYLKFSKKLREPLLMARNRKLRPRAAKRPKKPWKRNSTKFVQLAQRAGFWLISLATWPRWSSLKPASVDTSPRLIFPNRSIYKSMRPGLKKKNALKIPIKYYDAKLEVK